jgi:uncharacterized phage-associated protein
MVRFDEGLFDEECQAWAHGPVYKEVYDVFKNFKYSPIEDTRFAMLQNRFYELSEDEKQVIDLIVNSFGMYSGKTLERITHEEDPWKDARVACLPGERSNVMISKESIKQYFFKLSKKYEINSVCGVRAYINDRLQNT